MVVRQPSKLVTWVRFPSPAHRIGSRSRRPRWIPIATKLSHVDSARARQLLELWYKTLSARDFAKLGALIDEVADPDVVVEYPQSGERFRGKANNLAILENYPGLPEAAVKAVHGSEDKWVLTPSFTPLRISGTGDHYVVEGTVQYPSGETWHFVDLIELSGDRVMKITEYFGAPFPPAEWRAKWALKTESPAR